MHEIWHGDRSQTYLYTVGNTICKVTVTDMIKVLNFAIISDKFNIVCASK
jgi:hypothetical protein